MRGKAQRLACQVQMRLHNSGVTGLDHSSPNFLSDLEGSTRAAMLRFFYRLWNASARLPWQRRFSDHEMKVEFIMPTRVPILKIWWRSFQYILRWLLQGTAKKTITSAHLIVLRHDARGIPEGAENSNPNTLPKIVTYFHMTRCRVIRSTQFWDLARNGTKVFHVPITAVSNVNSTQSEYWCKLFITPC